MNNATNKRWDLKSPADKKENTFPSQPHVEDLEFERGNNTFVALEHWPRWDQVVRKAVGVVETEFLIEVVAESNKTLDHNNIPSH